jgi:hypothetical protein
MPAHTDAELTRRLASSTTTVEAVARAYLERIEIADPPRAPATRELGFARLRRPQPRVNL